MLVLELLTRTLIGVRHKGGETTMLTNDQMEARIVEAREREHAARRAALEAEAEAQRHNESALRSLVDTYRLRPPA
jgi:hypothetical protein